MSRNIDMSKVIVLAERHEFWAVRGKAIQSYANLEQALASLLAFLTGSSREAAATILFRISSSDSRNKILEKLFRQKYEDKLNLFRNSLFAQLRPIDTERNEIVHWNAACKMGLDANQQETAEVVLMPPASLTTANSKDTPLKSTEDIRAFSRKCDFYTALINSFPLMTEPHPHIPDDARKPWLEIFEQPVVYPPPTGHPLCRDPAALDGQIQAFLIV